MPCPKKKLCRSKRGMRRAHDFLIVPSAGQCQSCGALVRPHRVCQECGQYKSREVLQPRA